MNVTTTITGRPEDRPIVYRLAETAGATRVWFNQPSTLQPHHKWHGVNVLYIHQVGTNYGVAYFLSGDVVSMVITDPDLVFSRGWQ